MPRRFHSPTSASLAAVLLALTLGHGGEPASAAPAAPPAAKILFLVNDEPDNYEAARTIPAFAKDLQERRGHHCTVIQGVLPLEKLHFPGLEKLDTSDLLVVFFRRSALTPGQLGIIRRHLAAGKPLVGIRTANHAFSVKTEPAAGHEKWWEFVPEVLGCENRGYGKTEDGVDVKAVPEQSRHPILDGVEPRSWHSQGPLYLVKPLVDDKATVLLLGSGPKSADEPIAWTRMAGKSRIFSTSLGYPTDFELPQYRRLLQNGIEWALGRLPATAGDSTGGAGGSGAASVTAAASATGSGTKVEIDRLPRISPHEPAAAMATFEVAPGFRIEQVAAEPLLHSPVAIDFDDRGRCYVVEMIDYSEQSTDCLGAVRILEDVDGDGRMDKTTLFAKGLSWPTGVLCYDGGVFVCAAPDIYYLKDSDGDGVADVRRTVFTGFKRTNVQGLVNSLRWGLDSRVHGATSSSGAPAVTRPDDPSFKPVLLSGRDFSFDPRKLDLRPETGMLQHGMAFDDWGRKFVSGNSAPLEMVLFEDRYAGRNPYFTMPRSRRSIAKDGGADAVYRSSPVEPWRILRTKMRLANPALGAVEGGGRPAGYFTGATGITAYRGDALPAEMRQCVIVGDVGSNLVHRERLTPGGPFLEARRIDVENEFVRSEDIWFRPAQFANAPDGALYVIDVYREVIEHPHSLPPEIKSQLDLTSGSDRGRLYRVVPEKFAGRPRPDLGAASTADLVATLSHRNGWHRDTAARLLYERQDSAAVEPLEKTVRGGPLPEGRMHALYALEALGRLSTATILAALDDQHPRVREHAIRLADRRPTEASLAERLYRMTDDEDARVRYQLAFSLGEFPSAPQRNRALARLLAKDGGQEYPQAAIFSSLARGAGDVLAELSGQSEYAASPAGGEVLQALAAQIGQQLDAGDVKKLEAVLEKAITAKFPAAGLIVTGYLTGRAKAPAPRRDATPLPASVEASRKDLLTRSRATAVDTSAAEPYRVAAVGRLAVGSFADSADTFVTLFEANQPQGVQLAAVKALEALAAPETGGWLLARWPQLGPKVRGAVASAIFSRPEWVRAFLAAVDSGSVSLSEFDPAQVRLLESYKDPGIRAGYEKLAARVKASPRKEVLDAYRPVLDMAGDPSRGRDHFGRVCAQCHRVQGVGHELGPNLAAFKSRGPEAILTNVLDPNREVNPLYVNYVAQLDDGRTVSGMIADESAGSITFKRAENATDTVARGEIEMLKSTGQSIMPEGLEKQLDRQAFADLLAYLSTIP
jgi:putative membrane-bound dehydrogenase-like protein